MNFKKLIFFIVKDLEFSFQMKKAFEGSLNYEVICLENLPQNLADSGLIICDEGVFSGEFNELLQNSKYMVWVILNAWDEKKVLKAMQMGASDYIIRPISIEILKRKIEAFFLSVHKVVGVVPEFLEIGEISFDVMHLSLRFPDNSEEHLTPSEGGILKQLVMNKGTLCLRTDLLGEVKGNTTEIIPRNVDVHIASLRKKLKQYASWIVTVRGIGYKFIERPQELKTSFPNDFI